MFKIMRPIKYYNYNRRVRTEYIEMFCSYFKVFKLDQLFNDEET